MSAGSSGHEGEIEALVVDRYLESLLSRGPIDVDGVPPELEATARRLAGGLPRYHPSFRFEDALAARLAATAGRLGGGQVVPFPASDPGPADRRTLPERLAADRSAVGRAAVIGGVVGSAALSIAGAAFVAWRLSRPSLDPMSRAARAVARARVA